MIAIGHDFDCGRGKSDADGCLRRLVCIYDSEYDYELSFSDEDANVNAAL